MHYQILMGTGQKRVVSQRGHLVPIRSTRNIRFSGHIILTNKTRFFFSWKLATVGKFALCSWMYDSTGWTLQWNGYVHEMVAFVKIALCEGVYRNNLRVGRQKIGLVEGGLRQSWGVTRYTWETFLGRDWIKRVSGWTGHVFV